MEIFIVWGNLQMGKDNIRRRFFRSKPQYGSDQSSFSSVLFKILLYFRKCRL